MASSLAEPDLGLLHENCSSVDTCTGNEVCNQDSVDTDLLSGHLEVDNSIRLSRSNFEESINALIKNTELSDLEKVFYSTLYPKPGILAQFAERAYRTKEVKYDRDYEKQLNLPLGWKLLTIAENTALGNGYFGAAFWHPEYHQVVISHRGTKPTNLGSIYTDFKGVVYNEYASQMNSATTFTFIISSVLDKLNKNLGVHFELFFTGHSLGGWLAQVTTFAAKYLKRVESSFQKCINIEEGYHGHAYVFDTPGCRDTLLQMQKDFEIHMDETAFLDSLDITSYLSAPNRVNTCNSHTGTIHRVFLNLSQMSKLEELTPLYNIITHSIDNILAVFDPESGSILRDEFGNFRAQQVLDWPLSSGLDGGEEYILFFKWAKSVNNYHPQHEKTDAPDDNYETVRYLDRTCSISVFTQLEVQFLERYLMLQQLPDLFTPESLFDFTNDVNVVQRLCHTLKTFQIKERVVYCKQAQELEKFIPIVKRLLHFFPIVQCKALLALSSFDVVKNIFHSASKHYINSLNEIIDFQLDQEWEKSIVEGFLCTDNHNEQICCLTFGSKCGTRISLGIVYKAFTSFENHYHNSHLVLSLDWVIHQEQHICMSSFLDSEKITHYLLMIDCEQLSEIKCQYAAKAFFMKLFKVLSAKPTIKVFFFATRNDIIINVIMDAGNKFPIVNYRLIRREGKLLLWNDLCKNTQNILLKKKVLTFQGHEKISLAELLRIPGSDINNSIDVSLQDLIDPYTLAMLINNRDIKVCDPLPNFEDNYYIERSFQRNRISVHADILIDKNIRDIFILSIPLNGDISTSDTCFQSKQKVIKFEDLENYSKNIDFKIVFVKREEIKICFNHLCNIVGEQPIHVLNEEHNSLAWYMSHGSTDNIAKYKVSSETSAEIYDESSVFKSVDSKVVIISGQPRVGKSAVLTRIPLQFKKTSPLLWVVKIDLQDVCKQLALDVEDSTGNDLSTEHAIDMLWNMHATKCTSTNIFDERLFKSFFNLPPSMVILFDSLTELSFPYKEDAIKLIKVIMTCRSVAQVWVTANENARDALEMEFGTLAYNLVQFSEADQIKFFNDFWKCKLNLNEVDRARLDLLTETMINFLPSSIQEPTLDLTKLILHIKMLAELFTTEFKKSSTYETIPDVPDKLNLVELYKMFIYRKFQSYFNKITCDGDAVKIQLKTEAKEMLKKSFSVNPEYSTVYTLFEESPIYKFFEGSGVLTLLNRTKALKELEVENEQ